MAQLRQDHPKYSERNTEIIAIGPEDSASFTDWWGKTGCPHSIADPGSHCKHTGSSHVHKLAVCLPPAYRQERTDKYSHFGESMKDIRNRFHAVAVG
jgi:hypothetical protein